MTDSEKLNVILFKMDSLEIEIQDMKTEIQDMKTEVQNVKKDLSAFKRQTKKSVEELNTMDKLILNEVEGVHKILDMHKEDKTAHSA